MTYVKGIQPRLAQLTLSRKDTHPVKRTWVQKSVPPTSPFPLPMHLLPSGQEGEPFWAVTFKATQNPTSLGANGVAGPQTGTQPGGQGLGGR